MGNGLKAADQTQNRPVLNRRDDKEQAQNGSAAQNRLLLDARCHGS
jgi:hypothetical protein